MCSNDPCTEVEYDEATCKKDVKLHRDRHLRREEDAIRSLDTDAAEKHRHSRALQRQQAREHEAEIKGCLDFVICRLENQHARAVREQEQAATGAWRCPAGCPAGTDCARASFRPKCVPPYAQVVSEVQMHLERSWEQQHNVRQINDFTGPSGYRYVQRDTQCGMWRQQWEDLSAAGIYRPEFSVADSEVREVQHAFLKYWDGFSQPVEWLRAWVAGDAVVCDGSECLKVLIPNRNTCGHTIIVGPESCAWNGCDGCCYCRGVESPPISFKVLSISIDPSYPDTGYVHNAKSLTLTQLRAEVNKLSANPWLRGAEPVPAYLIDRSKPRIPDGRIICLPREISSHASQEELASWASQLAPASIRLLLLTSQSLRPTVPQRAADLNEWDINESDRAIINSHLAPHLILFKENKVAEREWETFNEAKREIDWQVEIDARRGCGLRNQINSLWPTARPSFRTGDLVYCPPAVGSSLPFVAVVMDVERSGGFGGNTGQLGFPTGEFRLLHWDSVALRFADRMALRSSAEWQLMPPCCGRGCNCPHLFSQMCAVASDDCPPQWPNGDDLDPSSLLAIPSALLELLRTELAQPPRKRQQAFESIFEKLTTDPLNPLASSKQAGEPCCKRQKWVAPTSTTPVDTSISHSIDSDCSDCMSICSNESSSVDWGSDCESDWVSSECDEC